MISALLSETTGNQSDYALITHWVLSGEQEYNNRAIKCLQLKIVVYCFDKFLHFTIRFQASLSPK